MPESERGRFLRKRATAGNNKRSLDQVATNTERSVNDQRIKLNSFRAEDQADLLQDIKLLAKEENL
jgi:hypothetical protein